MISEDELKERTILYVEDDEITRENLAVILKRMSRQVYLASNGKEGIEMWRSFNPDIIITDLEMPVMNGMDMIEKIKEESPEHPIVVATAFADEAHRVPMADAILVKPIEKKRLREILRQVAR